MWFSVRMGVRVNAEYWKTFFLSFWTALQISFMRAVMLKPNLNQFMRVALIQMQRVVSVCLQVKLFCVDLRIENDKTKKLWLNKTMNFCRVLNDNQTISLLYRCWVHFWITISVLHLMANFVEFGMVKAADFTWANCGTQILR